MGVLPASGVVGESRMPTLPLFQTCNTRLNDFAGQARTIFNRAAIAIGTFVGRVTDELVEQIAVRRMHFYPIETCPLGTLRSVPVLCGQTSHLLRRQGTRHRDTLEAVFGERMPLGLNHRWCDWRLVIRLKRHMGKTPDMPQLTDDLAAGFVHGVGDPSPACHLLVSPDARRIRIPPTLQGNIGGFADDQTGTGALGVVSSVQCPRYAIRAHTAAGQGRHRDAIGKFKVTQ